MGMIQIDGLDDALLERLRMSARRNGRTFGEEAAAHLEAAVGTVGGLASPAERLAEADRIRAMTPPDVAQSDSTAMIRALRATGYAGS